MLSIKEKVELLKDFEECIDRLQNFSCKNHRENEEWAKIKYLNWMSKDNKYASATPIATTPPKNEIEKSWNVLNNFGVTLSNIAAKNGIDINRKDENKELKIN